MPPISGYIIEGFIIFITPWDKRSGMVSIYTRGSKTYRVSFTRKWSHSMVVRLLLVGVSMLKHVVYIIYMQEYV